jgi:hypothetical protein
MQAYTLWNTIELRFLCVFKEYWLWDFCARKFNVHCIFFRRDLDYFISVSVQHCTDLKLSLVCFSVTSVIVSLVSCTLEWVSEWVCAVCVCVCARTCALVWGGGARVSVLGILLLLWGTLLILVLLVFQTWLYRSSQWDRQSSGPVSHAPTTQTLHQGKGAPTHALNYSLAYT